LLVGGFVFCARRIVRATKLWKNPNAFAVLARVRIKLFFARICAPDFSHAADIRGGDGASDCGENLPPRTRRLAFFLPPFCVAHAVRAPPLHDKFCHMRRVRMPRANAVTVALAARERQPMASRPGAFPARGTTLGMSFAAPRTRCKRAQKALMRIVRSASQKHFC
jgi:hypothetical protein